MADTRKGGTGTATERDERVLEGEVVPAQVEELDEPRGGAGAEEIEDDAVEMDEADEEEEDEEDDEDDQDDDEEDDDEDDDEDEDEDGGEEVVGDEPEER